MNFRPERNPTPITFPSATVSLPGCRTARWWWRENSKAAPAGFALTEGRDVFAVPGNVDSAMSQAPNWLIREGAVMARDAGDILAEYDLAEYRAAGPAGAVLPEQMSLESRSP